MKLYGITAIEPGMLAREHGSYMEWREVVSVTTWYDGTYRIAYADGSGERADRRTLFEVKETGLYVNGIRVEDEEE